VTKHVCEPRQLLIMFCDCCAGRQSNVVQWECSIQDHAFTRRRLRPRHLWRGHRLLGRRHQQIPVDGSDCWGRTSEGHQSKCHCFPSCIHPACCLLIWFFNLASSKWPDWKQLIILMCNLFGVGGFMKSVIFCSSKHIQTKKSCSMEDCLLKFRVSW